MQALVDKGEVPNDADLARLAHVSRARISQILNLLLLAPDIPGLDVTTHYRTATRTGGVTSPAARSAGSR